jgi:hypothetical protein
VNIQPWWSGSGIGPPVITQGNHNYVIQMVISAPTYVRYYQYFRTVEGEAYGGSESSATGNVTWYIQDYDVAAATGYFYQPTVHKTTLNNVSLPSFVTYAVVNNLQLNVSITNTTIAAMPLGTLDAYLGPSGLYQPTGAILPMLLPNSGWFDNATGYIGGVLPWPSAASANILSPPAFLSSQPFVQVMGNGYEMQVAQVSQGNEADTLAFYGQTLPAVGTPIQYQSWEAQAAVSRLQDQQSISEEGYIVGDNGIRSAIVTNLSPLPRTSEDCDNAALAYLQDRTGVFYNGTYQCTNAGPTCPLSDLQFFIPLTTDVQFWPTCGRFLNVNAPARGIVGQKMLVSQFQVSILDLNTELLQFQFQFGADLHLEKVLLNFVDLQPPNVLTPQDLANPPNPRYTQNVNNSYLPDLNNVVIDPLNITNTSVNVQVNDPYYGLIEVRKIDSNWGRGQTADFIGLFVWPSFQLARTQIDQQWFMRAVQYTSLSPSGTIGSSWNPGTYEILSVSGGYAFVTGAKIAGTIGSENGAGNELNASTLVFSYNDLVVQSSSTIPSYPGLIGIGNVITALSSNTRPFTNADLGNTLQILPLGNGLQGIASRRSKVLRVNYPVQPNPPLFTNQNNSVFQWNYSGDLRNIYGFELRAFPGSMINAASGLLSAAGYTASGILNLATPQILTGTLASQLQALAASGWAEEYNSAWYQGDYEIVSVEDGQAYLLAPAPAGTLDNTNGLAAEIGSSGIVFEYSDLVVNSVATTFDGVITIVSSPTRPFTVFDIGNSLQIVGRANQISDILWQRPALSLADMQVDVTQTPFVTMEGFDLNFWLFFAYFFSLTWSYSQPLIMIAPPNLLGKVEFGTTSNFVAGTLTTNTQVKTGFSINRVVWNISADIGAMPQGQDAIFDIQVSTDSGNTWNSIFPAGTDNELVISSQPGAPMYGQVNDFSITVINPGDWVKVVCVQAGTTVAGSGLQASIQ